MKRYTAKEMRDMALCVDNDVFSDGSGNYEARGFMGFDPDIISSMLRQAADDYEKTTSMIESRLGRSEKRQKHELANALFECCSWTIGKNPRVCNVDCEKVERIFHRLRAEADSIESEVSNV